MSDTFRIAKEIVNTLVANGHQALFAGGWVRDYLLQKAGDDIDIATSASPKEVQEIFPKTYAIGESFGVILVREEELSFEVATFRTDLDYKDGRHPQGVKFTSAKEDALRRDFTINGLFYDPIKKEILDFVNGEEDLRKSIVRAIGDPIKRFSEDRLRMVRGCRFAASLSFEMEEKTLLATQQLADTLYPSVSVERIWQELEKMNQNNAFLRSLHLLEQAKLFTILFPKAPVYHNNQMLPLLDKMDVPTVLYLPFIYQSKDASFLENLCLHFKLSQAQRILLQNFTVFLNACLKPTSSTQWAKLYAHPQIDLFITLATAWPETDKQHTSRRINLEAHTDRIRMKKPLIKAKDLMEEGVMAGKILGELLELAESLSIEKDLHDKQQLISLLKRSKLWPL